MSEKENMPETNLTHQILNELRKMSKILILSNGSKLEEELGRYATSDERKKMWVLIDGKRKTADIAKDVGTTTRSVERFLKILEDAELITERRYGEPPVKMIAYVPASWLEIETQTKLNPQPSTETSQVMVMEGDESGRETV